MCIRDRAPSAATKLCSGDAIVEPAIRERALRWVPEQLAFVSTVSEDDAVDGDGEGTSVDIAGKEEVPAGEDEQEDDEADALVADFAEAA